MIVRIWLEESQRVTTRLSIRLELTGDNIEASFEFGWVIQLLLTGLHVRFHSRLIHSKATLHALTIYV